VNKKRNKSVDSNTIVAIEQMADQYQDSAVKIQLEKYERDNLILIEQLRDLKQALEERDSRIAHLESMLQAKSPEVASYQPILNNPISDEEIIALRQLEFLKQASQMRPLSLEETKIYDLLVKNKRLSQGDSTGIIDTVKLPKEKAKLLEIASKKINEPQEQ
jgi:hypothetical protein